MGVAHLHYDPIQRLASSSQLSLLAIPCGLVESALLLENLRSLFSEMRGLLTLAKVAADFVDVSKVS
ncbi:MAG: hypothetical protein WAR24_08675 [Candidatus Acidiferrales bacterium]